VLRRGSDEEAILADLGLTEATLDQEALQHASRDRVSACKYAAFALGFAWGRLDAVKRGAR
jgi:hypothetical protein